MHLAGFPFTTSHYARSWLMHLVGFPFTTSHYARSWLVNTTHGFPLTTRVSDCAPATTMSLPPACLPLALPLPLCWPPLLLQAEQDSLADLDLDLHNRGQAGGQHPLQIWLQAVEQSGGGRACWCMYIS